VLGHGTTTGVEADHLQAMVGTLTQDHLTASW
jgi:hypothetical protein